MENGKTEKPIDGIKPKEGAWDNMQTEGDRKPKVKFEFDQPQVVILKCDGPREISWEDSVFYVFDVEQDGEERVITTSAWSLLRGLKELEPLNNKVVKITKKMDSGKQRYFVELTEDKPQTKEENVTNE